MKWLKDHNEPTSKPTSTTESKQLITFDDESKVSVLKDKWKEEQEKDEMEREQKNNAISGMFAVSLICLAPDWVLESYKKRKEEQKRVEEEERQKKKLKQQKKLEQFRNIFYQEEKEPPAKKQKQVFVNGSIYI